eukprot:scaffold67443_cov52-Phaeocystis_antarctica.AAC.1
MSAQCRGAVSHGAAGPWRSSPRVPVVAVVAAPPPARAAQALRVGDAPPLLALVARDPRLLRLVVVGGVGIGGTGVGGGGVGGGGGGSGSGGPLCAVAVCLRSALRSRGGGYLVPRPSHLGPISRALCLALGLTTSLDLATPSPLPRRPLRPLLTAQKLRRGWRVQVAPVRVLAQVVVVDLAVVVRDRVQAQLALGIDANCGHESGLGSGLGLRFRLGLGRGLGRGLGLG